jgi:hypothetical protein
MRSRSISGLALLVLLLGPSAARCDEIRLKDGTKITGTIVGFEDGAFRVETSYGFALIQKDKVADINITAAKKDPEPKAKSTGPSAPPSAPPSIPAPAVVPAIAKEPASAAGASAEIMTPAPDRTPTAKTEAPLPKPRTVAAAAPTPPPPATPPPPPPAPEPVVIRDEIRGNLYVNLTYGFQMYKPPSWDLIPDARKALPDAVAALGTNDETSLLVIGREHAKDSLDAHAAATGKTLSGVYDNYRLISNQHVAVAGFPAIEMRSRGTADGHDWSVLLVTFLRGSDAYTLLGMTWADSDLIQLQENVISKTVNSLAFTTQ